MIAKHEIEEILAKEKVHEDELCCLQESFKCLHKLDKKTIPLLGEVSQTSSLQWQKKWIQKDKRAAIFSRLLELIPRMGFFIASEAFV